MRNKIAGINTPNFNMEGLEFQFHKYYSPQNFMEENFTSLNGFRHTCAKHKGLFSATLPDGAKIFAVKFTPCEDEFPFVSLADYCTYKDGYILIGADIKKQAYFLPVF